MCPELILFDFEMGAINAVRDSETFGEYCLVRCCQFHYSQALLRGIRAVKQVNIVYSRKPSESDERGSYSENVPAILFIFTFSLFVLLNRP